MQWLTPKQVSEATGFATQTLANWRVLGKGPAYVRLGRSVRYSEDEVERFMMSGRADA
jgi:predicted DNA-binding transcriptional regulator AlpA